MGGNIKVRTDVARNMVIVTYPEGLKFELRDRLTTLQLIKGDPEGVHIAADKLLTDLLGAFGFSEETKIFWDIDKWYS